MTGSKKRRRSTSRASSKRRRVGSYVTAPIAKSLRAPKAKIVKINGGKSIRVANREYVCDIKSIANDTGFSARYQGFLNPGNASLCPWLATIARHFERYKFKYLKFTYESATTSSTTGQVMISPDYDAADEQPSSWAAAACQMGTAHGACWDTVTCVLDTKSLNNAKHYTTASNTPTAQQDQRDVNAGVVYVFIDGISLNGGAIAFAMPLGKLYVSYDVELIEPEYGNELIADASESAKWSVATAVLPTLTTGQQLIGYIPKLYGALPVVENAATNTWTFTQAGEWLVIAECGFAADPTFAGGFATVGSTVTLKPADSYQRTALTSWPHGWCNLMYVQSTKAGDTLQIQIPTWTDAAKHPAAVTLRFAPYTYAYV